MYGVKKVKKEPQSRLNVEMHAKKTRNHDAYAINTDVGIPKWTFDTGGGAVRSSPAVANDLIAGPQALRVNRRCI